MGRRASRVIVATLLGAAVVVASAGVALAVSGGGYQPGEQDCPANADARSAPKGYTTAGCHNFKLNLEDERGNRYAEAGLDQLPTGYPSTPGIFGLGYPANPNSPHSGCIGIHPNGAPGGSGRACGANAAGPGAAADFDIQHARANRVTPHTGAADFSAVVKAVRRGLVLYLGADDNLDAGEHDGAVGSGSDGRPDGSSGSINGPSDGGAIRGHVTPGSASTAPSLTDPLPLAGLSGGACADGFCAELTTAQQAIYHGNSQTSSQRQAADYTGKQFDPYDCSSGDTRSEGPACADGNPQHPQTMDGYRNGESRTVNAEPGVQIYEDPDPQGSPIDPIHEAHKTPGTPLYPIPAVYAGSCGVIAGGGPVAKVPAGTPGANSAGQLQVSRGC